MFNLGRCHGGDIDFLVDDVGILMQFYYDYVFVGDLEMCLGLQFGGRREEKWRWEAADGGEGCWENADVGNEIFNR